MRAPATVSETRAALPVSERLRVALQHVTDPPVEVRETHLSWVLLTPDRAYKLRKPVRLPFVDQSTPAHRRALSEAEARLSGELAEGLVLGVRAVIEVNTSFALAHPDTPGAVDWVVEMRRFDERDTMASRVARGELAAEQAAAVGARLAAFHAQAGCLPGEPAVSRQLAMVSRNAEELLALLDGVAPATELLAVQRFLTAFIVGHRALLAARAAAGRVVDGHGDLRADHVLLENDRVLMVDRLEFDRDLRTVDVADDLAFLVMDLLARGADDAAREVVGAYRRAGGDPGPDALIALYAAHRALVRTKVALLRASELLGEDRECALAEARRLLTLAGRLAWRGRGPLLLVVCGPPGSGKSTLARALAAASGLPVLSSDRERKRLLGVAPDASAPAEAYSDAARAEVYRDLAEGAGTLLADGDGVIVDATLGSPTLQAAFLNALNDHARDALRVIRCAAGPDVLAHRLAGRRPHDAEGSDADAEVGARLAAEAVTPPVPCRRRLVVETDAAPAEMVARVAAWLDEALGESGDVVG